MHRIRKISQIAVYGTYAVCGGLLVMFLAPGIGWKPLDVATSSMTPAVPRGSMVLVHKVPYSQIKIGDIITYKSPTNLNQTITHRVVETGSLGSIPTFTTKGDANTSMDQPVVGGSIVGKVVWHAPYLGYSFDWLRSPVGLLLLLIIPGIVIIISELRRLWRELDVDELPSMASNEPQFVAERSTAAISVRRPRRLDGLGPLAVAIIAVILMAQPTLAQLNTHATLKSTTISTAARANHLLISRVSLGGGVVCNAEATHAVNISHTGDGSSNSVLINDSCTVIGHTFNHIAVKQSSSQDALSGNVIISNSGQSSGSSGSANNHNSHITTVIINNGQSPASSQTFELYNPTADPVTLTGWTVSDNTNVKQSLPLLTVGSGASVTIASSILDGGKIGNGLTGTGDRLSLEDTSGTAVDGVSWGSDTSVLNPAVPAISSGGNIQRLNPNYDTDTAVDWIAAP